MTGLLSPTTGRPLSPDGPASLTDGTGRWPVVDGIPFLRTGREDLIRAVLSDLDGGQPEAALVRLLADQDEWWDGPRPPEQDLRRLVRDRDRLSLRDAMGCLAYGRVGDYFAHRWTDPTFLAGLALLDAHWSGPATAFELACGIGHYLRELAAAGVRVTGGDVVFSKLWIARHWVVGPDADLVCFDARSPWPIAARSFDLCLCQDAFYFLEPKAQILDRLRGLLRQDGQLAVGHVHNRDAANMSAGAGVTAGEVDRLFPDARVYDDCELTAAAGEGRAPVSRPASDLRTVEAFSIAEGGPISVRAADGPMCRPGPDAPLRRNPLYRSSAAGIEIVWPSERYRTEYAGRATYRLRTELPDRPESPSAEQVRRREVVALPARW